MIVWLNGPFGVGKTTTTRALLAVEPSWSSFDAERVGYLLRPVLGPPRPVADFQDWPAWRRLTVAVLTELVAELGTTVVVPQTVVVESYWTEIDAGLAEGGVSVLPITLHADHAEHGRRVARDWRELGARGWRRERRADYDRALPWLQARTTVLDTTGCPATQIADRVRGLVARAPRY